jgi:hypothetical protein
MGPILIQGFSQFLGQVLAPHHQVQFQVALEAPVPSIMSQVDV